MSYCFSNTVVHCETACERGAKQLFIDFIWQEFFWIFQELSYFSFLNPSMSDFFFNYWEKFPFEINKGDYVNSKKLILKEIWRVDWKFSCIYLLIGQWGLKEKCLQNVLLLGTVDLSLSHNVQYAQITLCSFKNNNILVKRTN